MNTSIEAGVLIKSLEARPVELTTFPSHFDIAIQIKNAMHDTRLSIKNIGKIIKKDPLISTKIVRSANAAGIYTGHSIADIESAVSRLGFDAVKRIVLGVVLLQLTKAKEMIPFSNISRFIWLHSIYTASAAKVVTRRLTKLNPSEAFYSGLVLNMGAFYLLYQAAAFPILKNSIDDVIFSISKYYLKRTIDVLKVFEVNESVITAIDIRHIQSVNEITTPQSQTDIIYIANYLASAKFPWITKENSQKEIKQEYQELIPEIEEVFMQTRSEYV